jgi:hypothetical protein
MKKTKWALVALMCLLSTAPSQAQYTNPHTGRTWNNPTSSLLDTMILNKSWEMIMRGNMTSANTMTSANFRALLLHRQRLGRQKIKSGKATTRFSAAAPFSLSEWVTRCGAKTPQMRRQYAAEITLQQAIWKQEAQARGASTQDMAQSLALGFVLSWEAYTGGKRATNAQYRGIAADFRKTLLKDPDFQGMTAKEKQYLYEDQMILATDAVRLLREATKTGDAATLQKARDGGKRYLTRWWDKPAETLRTTATGFTSE